MRSLKTVGVIKIIWHFANSLSMRLLVFLVFLTCAFCSQCGNYSTCGSCGWDTLNYSNDNIAPLDNDDPGSLEFRQNAKTAIEILQVLFTSISTYYNRPTALSLQTIPGYYILQFNVLPIHFVINSKTSAVIRSAIIERLLK